ncbi:hypothetical protein [Chryseobacterium taichungense]|nr:hypothetical protein [Chryseobacterium taichungense]
MVYYAATHEATSPSAQPPYKKAPAGKDFPTGAHTDENTHPS